MGHVINSGQQITLNKRVTNRDGTQSPFDAGRILSAILRAGRATDEFGDEAATLLTQQVIANVEQRIPGNCPDIEDIQSEVESCLLAAGYLKTARAYIAYREQHQRLRQDREVTINATASVNEYLGRQDWRVQANANQGYSLGGLILNVAGKVIANYWLGHVYP